ncbi:hypothetical protein MHYP_G00025570 [Metynnis hypsauchen]
MGQWSQLGDFDYHFPSVSAQQLLVEISGIAYRDLLTAQSCYSRCQAGADVDANVLQSCCGERVCRPSYRKNVGWPPRHKSAIREPMRESIVKVLAQLHRGTTPLQLHIPMCSAPVHSACATDCFQSSRETNNHHKGLSAHVEPVCVRLGEDGERMIPFSKW